MTPLAPWLPNGLPEDWDVVQMRRFATFRNGADYKDVEVENGGYPVYGSGGEFRRASDYLYEGDSVLFGRMGAINRPLLVSGRFWTVDTMFFTELSADIEPRFLYYYATMMPFDFYSTNTALPSMTQGDLGGHRMPLPPLDEQRVISDYLDSETGRIDTLIEEQQRLIEMLRERRQTQVDYAVWSGLGDEPRTPCPVEPAPDIPAHWRMVRNKNLLSESTEVSADGSEELLSVSHLTGITPRSEKNVTVIEAESLDGYRIVEPGDLVINTMWAWMGALGVSQVKGIVSPAYGVYRPLPSAEFHPPYYDYPYRSWPYVVEMTRYSRGIWSSRLRIYPDVFLRLQVPVPPLEEQRRIAAYLDEKTAKIAMPSSPRRRASSSYRASAARR